MKKKLLSEAVRTARARIANQNHPQYNFFIHYTFVVVNKRLMGFGVNREGRPFYDGFGYHKTSKIHSEADAYNKYKGLIKSDFSVINLRFNRQGMLRMAKPCDCCTAFLIAVNCSTAIYSTRTGSFAKMRFN